MRDAGAALRRARKQAGLSQRELAERAGVKQPHISRIESGRQQPTLPTLVHLVNKCGFDLRLEFDPLDAGHDPTLLESSLRLTPEERVERLVSFVRTIRGLRGSTWSTTWSSIDGAYR